MRKKNTKTNVLDKMLLLNRYAVFRASAVLFLIAAAFFAILLFGYSKNNKEAASRLLYETAYQKAEGIKGSLNAELSYLEALTEIQQDDTTESLFDTGKYKGLTESVYVKKAEEISQNASDISVLEDGNIQLFVKKRQQDFLCARLSREKLEGVVDNGSFDGKSSVILYEASSGNVVINTAKKHGFEGHKIGFLLNHSFGRGFSAKKMFSDIDDNKSGYTEIEAAGQKYSICYVPVMTGDLYVLMFVPKSAIYPSFPEGIETAFLAIVLIVLVVCAVLFALMGTKKASDNRKIRKFYFDILNTALFKLSEDDCIGVYIYRKSEDVLDVIKDFNSSQREITLNDGFSCLVQKTGVDEADKRKLKNAVNLSGPGKDMRINVISRLSNETVNTQITFSCIKAYNQNAIVCVVKRCQQQTKETFCTKEPLTHNGLNTTCIELFLERNMWHFLWNNEPVFDKTSFGTGMQDNYDVQLKKEILPYIKMPDRERVLAFLDRLSMLEDFRNGEFEKSVVFDISDNEGNYSQRRLDVRIYRDNYNDEIKANFYIQGI